MIVLQLPKVERKNTQRPRQCKYCQGEFLQRWGQVNKQVKDTKVRKVKVCRYRCTRCERTFRHYPAGVRRAMQSERLEKLVVIIWSMGLSYRGISLLLSAFGIAFSRMADGETYSKLELDCASKWAGREYALQGSMVPG